MMIIETTLKWQWCTNRTRTRKRERTKQPIDQALLQTNHDGEQQGSIDRSRNTTKWEEKGEKKVFYWICMRTSGRIDISPPWSGREQVSWANQRTRHGHSLSASPLSLSLSLLKRQRRKKKGSPIFRLNLYRRRRRGGGGRIWCTVIRREVWRGGPGRDWRVAWLGLSLHN